MSWKPSEESDSRRRGGSKQWGPGLQIGQVRRRQRLDLFNLALGGSMVTLIRAVLMEWWIEMPDWSVLKRMRRRTGNREEKNILSFAMKGSSETTYKGQIQTRVISVFFICYLRHYGLQFNSVTQSCLTLCNHVTTACQASLSTTNSRSLLKFTSIELVVPSNRLILCRPLLLPPSVFSSIKVFSNESVLCITWPKYWSFSFSISPSNEYSGLISFRMDWSDLLAVQPWHKPNRTRENGMACFKAKHKQTEGFLRWVSGPQLLRLLEADGTQEWGG